MGVGRSWEWGLKINVKIKMGQILGPTKSNLWVCIKKYAQ